MKKLFVTLPLQVKQKKHQHAGAFYLVWYCLLRKVGRRQRSHRQAPVREGRVL